MGRGATGICGGAGGAGRITTGRTPGALGSGALTGRGVGTGGLDKFDNLVDSLFASTVAVEAPSVGRAGRLIRTVSFFTGVPTDSPTVGRGGSVMRTVSFLGSLSLGIEEQMGKSWAEELPSGICRVTCHALSCQRLCTGRFAKSAQALATFIGGVIPR